MQLKVGSHYVTRNGAYVVRIKYIYPNGAASIEPMIYGERSCWSDGKIKFNMREHEGDLVAEVNPISIKLEDLL